MSDGAQLVAVTGAAGFIGGRAVERLVLERDDHVRAVVRNYGRLARLSPLPQRRLEFWTADVTDVSAMSAALEGCTAVVHCAYGNAGSVDERYRTTVDGTLAVLTAAREAGVRRFVHVSTSEVYDSSTLDVLDESAPSLPDDPTDMEYERQKLAAERFVLAASDGGMDCVVLQPGVVYGPWGAQWTTAQLRRLPTDNACLPTGDDGHCNAIYVDDLVNASFLALEAPDVNGERFLVSGRETVSWGAFFDQYRAMLGLPRPDGGCASPRLPDWESELYARRAAISGEHARERLGFTATATLDEGMLKVKQWAQWMGYVPSGESWLPPR